MNKVIQSTILTILISLLGAIPVFADSSSSAIYGDEGSVENSSNFSVTVEELNALELRLSASDLVLDLNPTSDTPVFGSSDLSVTVYTTNTTGYYLTMTPTYQSVATTNLTRTESLSGSYPTIATLSSTASPSTFASTSDTTTSNKWGYKVNTTNLATVDTTIYNPTIAASIPLNKTNTPINTGDETDITFAAKVDSETPAGSYKVDLNFTAITNANTYSITFNSGSASSDASLANMPSPNPQTGALESGSSTSITLSSSTPTRAGYSFLGWCSVAPTTSNNTDSCSGTTYQPGGSITIYTDTPDITLYAIWSLNSYVCTKQYRLQNADGTWGNYITDTTEQVAYGSTCSYTKSVTNYTGVSGTNSQSASTSGTMGTSGLTLQLDFYRNTYRINVTNSNTTSGASSLTIRYGGSATVTVTPSSGYYLSGVSCPSGYTCSGYNTGTSYTSQQTVTVTNNGATSGGTLSFTGAVACTISGTMQGVTSLDSYSVGDCGTLTDTRTSTAYDVKVLSLNGTKTLWMMSNLKLPGGTVLTTSNSNVSSSYTLPSQTGWTSSSQDDYCKPRMAYVNSNGEYYYNWPAATARTNSTSGTLSCSNDTSNSVGDICPKGWRLPVYSGEADNSTWRSNLQANGSLTTTGYFGAGSQYSVGSYGYWWASTRYDDNRARNLYSNGSKAYSDYNGKSSGRSVRCMRTS